jgi:hypothetical protein
MLGRIDKELLKELQKTRNSQAASTTAQGTSGVDFKSVLQGAVAGGKKPLALSPESKDSLMRAIDAYSPKGKIDDTNLFPDTGNLFPPASVPTNIPGLSLDGNSIAPPGNSTQGVSNNLQDSRPFGQTQANSKYRLVPPGGTAPAKAEASGDDKPKDWGIADAPKAASSKNAKVNKYERYINKSAATYGLDPALIKAVIVAESGGNANARSRAGARGLMQLMPATAADLGVKNSYDPQQNIEGGSRYLRQLLDRYNGNLHQALAAYNWGMGNLERRPDKMPQETKNYIAKIEGYYRSYSEDPTLA